HRCKRRDRRGRVRTGDGADRLTGPRELVRAPPDVVRGRGQLPHLIPPTIPICIPGPRAPGRLPLSSGRPAGRALCTLRTRDPPPGRRVRPLTTRCRHYTARRLRRAASGRLSTGPSPTDAPVIPRDPTTPP